MTSAANPVPPQLAYACSSCPECSCAARNAAQQAAADALRAVRVSAASDAVPAGRPPVGFWGEAPRHADAGQGPCPACTAAEDACVRERPTMGALGMPYSETPGFERICAERTFTRAEVLAVLRFEAASCGVELEPRKTLGRLIFAFERME